MNPELSRRVALAMARMTDEVDLTTRVDLTKATQAVKSFDDLPSEMQDLVRRYESDDVVAAAVDVFEQSRKPDGRFGPGDGGAVSGRDVTDVELPGEDVTVSARNGGDVVPWSKKQNHADCPSDRPWAVVKDDDGEVEGCHATEAEADEQVAALYAAEGDGGEEEAGGKPNPGTKRDRRLHENNEKKRRKSAADQAEVLAMKPEDVADAEIVDVTYTQWKGPIVVEGEPTGDGREFAPNSLTWGELPIPLRWNVEDSHGGMPSTKAVLVGRIDEIWREGNRVMGMGMFDVGGENGREARRLMQEGFLNGISVDVDDISEADVELVFPEGEGEEDDEGMFFLMPEKTIFHGGRIRAATLVDIPAFIDAKIKLIDPGDEDEVVAASANVVAAHETATSDGSWDLKISLERLGSRLSVDTLRHLSAWVNTGAVTSGAAGSRVYDYAHHEVSEAGEVGAANLTACAELIARLNSDADLPQHERIGVYEHLASHLRDADLEAMPLRDAVTAAAPVLDERPPSEWFTDPKLSLPSPVVITDDGRVYGHAAMWGECHVGHPDVCVQPPRETDHPYYMTGEVVCADGSRVAVGQITVGTGHASLSVGASRAAEHYDNTGTAVADVAVGNDEHGIWVAGAIRPDATAARVRDLRAAGQVSGDWRRVGGQLRLVGLLAVNVPGFPVPKLATRLVASGASDELAPLALVAAGRPNVGRGGPVVAATTEEELDKRALRMLADRLADRLKSSGRK